MKVLFAAVLVVHGLIHLMGTVKALGFAEIPQLIQQIPRPLGVLWLLAAAILLVTAIALFAWPQWWWAVGAGAILISQFVIITSWSDAKYGSIVNLVILVGVLFGFLSEGPTSFRSEYEHEVRRGLGRPSPAKPILTEVDLAQLPAAVQRYVRLSGAIGQPQVVNFQARFHGQMRRGASARWMSVAGEQYNFYDQPSRLFLMDGWMFGLQFQAFHRFIGPAATMRVKLLSLVTVVDAKGPEMDEAETVTLFNDMCVFAPAALVNRGIQWQEMDPHTVSASFTNATHTVRAILSFNDRGELTNFVSDDRTAASADGKSFTKMRWSTPVRDYQTFGSHRVMTKGECVWHAPEGDYTYLRFELDAIKLNVERSGRQRP